MRETIVLIADGVIERITAEAHRFRGRKERGGILIGQRREEHLHVHEATLPMRFDWGTRFAFRRCAAGHQAIATRRWRSSGGTMDWIGEWHSHPQAVPSPSAIDLASWRGIVARRQAPMLFVIIGYDEHWAGVLAPGARRPLEYRVMEDSREGIAYKWIGAQP